MSKLRIVADNPADRCTISMSTTAGALVAANLLIDDKSVVARATGTSLTITGTTTVSEIASCAALLFFNGSPTATMRVRLYSDTAGTTLALDTNTLQPGALACPAPARVLRGWTAAQAASAYSNGGGAYARIWFAPTAFKKYVIDIVDANNVQGYIEAARLVLGKYWEPEYNAAAAPLKPVDSTTMSRNGAGGLMRKAGNTHREVDIELRLMGAADRTALVNLLMNSRAYPILVSVFQGHSDLSLERDYMVYGCIPEDADISIQYADAYASKVRVEEI